MTSQYSRDLTPEERRLISGRNELYREEPEQILPIPIREEEKIVPKKELTDIKQTAEDMKSKIKELLDKTDKRCAGLSVETQEEIGSRLFQAMVRVFGERTTTITYDHYKKALEYREQLAQEEIEVLKKS